MKRTICIFLVVLISILSGCAGSSSTNKKGTSSPGESTQVKNQTGNSKEAAQKEQSVKEMSDKEFFDQVTEHVRKNWEHDAKLYKVFTIVFNEQVDKLPTLSHYSIWELNYVSPSKKTAIHLALNINQNPKTALTDIWYFYKEANTGEIKRAPIEVIKKDSSNKINEEDVSKDLNVYKAASDEWFDGWDTNFKVIGSKLSDRIKQGPKKQDSMIGINLYHCIKYAGLQFNVPVWDISWKDEGDKPHYYIVNAKTGEVLLDGGNEEVSKKK